MAALDDANRATDALGKIEAARAAAECRAVYPIRKVDGTYVASICRRILAAQSNGGPRL